MILVEPTELNTRGIKLENNLDLIPPEEIVPGNDCDGNAANLFNDNVGLRFRNSVGRVFLIIRNDHEFLKANVRVVTAKTYDTLALEDLIESIDPGKHKIFGPFQAIFQTAGDIDVTTSQGIVIQQTYQDFIYVNFSHDGSEVENTISAGVFHV